MASTDLEEGRTSAFENARLQMLEFALVSM